MNSHFDIGTIQAFMDGELSHERVDQVSSHIAACENCALLLAEAEDESAIVFPALEREFDTLVPTHRLWNKINDSITIEKANAPFWQKAWAFLSVAIASPSLASAAGVIIVFAVVLSLWINRPQPAAEVASVSETKTSATIVSTGDTAVPPSSRDRNTGDTIVTARPSFQVERASYQAPRRGVISPAVVKTSNAPDANGLPGEESYVKTISTLAKSVEGEKDTMMRPSERVAYERDLAVVNDSISKMRQEVKKNPKNDSAKQVLYASYQNKIDLLSSVSQKQELMASFK